MPDLIVIQKLKQRIINIVRHLMGDTKPLG